MSVQTREPGKLLRIALDRVCRVASRAPVALCPTEDDREALRDLMTNVFPMFYAKRPLQNRMRAEGGGCEFTLRPADLHSDSRRLAFVRKADFERSYDVSLTPGESFGVAVLFCDASGQQAGCETVILPTGEGVHWPPPLTFIPGLDPLCNVMYHVVDTAPLEIFSSATARDHFRDDLFRRIVPSVYQLAYRAQREAGRPFVLTVPADQSQNFQVRVLSEDDRVENWMMDGVEPGESFPLVINFEAGDASHFVMPCMNEWPTPWVVDWLTHRPPSDACRRCGTMEQRLKKCMSCRSVRYCSKECQRADWERHKMECVLVTGVRENQD